MRIILICFPFDGMFFRRFGEVIVDLCRCHSVVVERLLLIVKVMLVLKLMLVVLVVLVVAGCADKKISKDKIVESV